VRTYDLDAAGGNGAKLVYEETEFGVCRGAAGAGARHADRQHAAHMGGIVLELRL